MRYRVKIRASFEYEADVEAKNKTKAIDLASDVLYDYLETEVFHDDHVFRDFHENRLHEEVIKLEQLD